MKKKLFIIFSIFWVIGVSYLLVHMHAWHSLTIKSQVAQDFVLPEVASGKFGIVHFLGEGCGCSKIIAEHLARRGKIPGVKEEVWLLGNMKEVSSLLEKAGLTVKLFQVSKESNPPINAVPAFGVYDHNKKFHYMGAYTDGPVRPHSEFKDLVVLKSIQSNRKVASMNVNGCVVSKQYQKLLDPFGIKYGAINE